MYLVFIRESFVQEKLLNIFYIPGPELAIQHEQADAKTGSTDLVVRWGRYKQPHTQMSVPIVAFLTTAVNMPMLGEGKIWAAASNAKFISECISHQT